MIWALEMLWRRSLPVLVAILLVDACSIPSPSARGKGDLPGLPRLTIANFRPQIRDQVLKAYQEVETKPKDPDSNGRMGMLLHAFQQYESAELCYRRARILDPNRFQWAYYLGLAQALDGKNQEAAATLQDAIRLDPGYLPARLKMAEVLLISGRLDESQAICQSMAKDDPQVAPVYYWLGRVASAKGQVTASIEHYRQACQLWPSFGTAHYALALDCERTGQTAEALRHMAAYRKYKADGDPQPEDALLEAVRIVSLLAGCSSRPPAHPAGARFREAAAESGLGFQHFTGATGRFYLPEIMGSGVALLDYDGDGDLDIFLVQGTVLEPGKGNRLFRNMLKETGKLQFVDVTEQAGLSRINVSQPGYGMGVAVGDYNNDGHPDLYVTGFHDTGGWSASAAFVDYDKDGYLDLYVTHYLDFTVRGNKECFDPAGERDYCAPTAYKPVLHRLFRNLGNGKFQDVTEAAGIAAAVGPGLGVTCADFNGDGWPDIYVANDGAANLLWLNNGNGTFREAALLSGAAYSADGVARAGMGAAAGDFDGTGNESILVTNLTREGAAFYRNHGRGEFSDATVEFGLYQPTFPYTGFGVGWFDYDNDGRPDLFIANGAVAIMETLRGTPYPFHQRNLLLHNEGARFRETSGEAGPPFRLSEVGRGAAFGDIDNDGRIDIVVTNNNGPVRLLLNQTEPAGHWLEVRLQGVKSNRDGIGARVAVLREGRAPLWRRVHTDGSYLSASDPRVHFGLGERPADRVVVEWPDGLKETWDHVPVDSFLTLREGTGRP